MEVIKNALIAGYPVIAINTQEEDQTVAALGHFSKSVYGAERSLINWDLKHGLCGGAGDSRQASTPEAALDSVFDYPEPAFFVFRDIASFLGRPEIIRRIRELNFSFRGQNRFVFLLGAEISIPPELGKDIHLIDFQLPDISEVREIIDRSLAAAVKKGAEVKLSEEQLGQAAVTLKGFTGAEVQHSLNKLFWGAKTIGEPFLSALQDEKEQLAKKSGILEYVRVSASINEVGGLANLKEWLMKRKRLFSPEAKVAGITPPRGLLMMGISGCGKSLSVKAISHLWNLPLFRLDMNQIYSGIHGTPEAAFHRAIKFIEGVAPAILWIDEIEGGISSVAMKDGGTGSHIFSAFLTWMQEKSADVFVAATANRIDLLPAEIIRKGRFDQVFFIDLPNDKDREEIFKVHLRKRNVDPEPFDLVLLSIATEFWNGAEIEHVVEAALVEAFDRGVAVTQDDLYTIIRGTVPLSRTMSEQIKFIKLWASERAVSASAKPKS
ncbi:hypothetical protein AUK22_06970 [bacterium CG2_30_54_10]|nr:MAG: hypothetical protein AUK22_06970 [bacterium CG2_30_54_10]